MKLLVIRRDNIGDLICTTPLIRKLRQKFPDAQIDALVNSYNLPVVRNLPELDSVFSYTKAKHRTADQSFLGVHFSRLCMLWKMRNESYDYVILANGGCLPRPLALARALNPKHIVGFIEDGNKLGKYINLGVNNARPEGMHEVENLQRLLSVFDITDQPLPVSIHSDETEVASVRAKLLIQHWYKKTVPTLAIHISSRKPPQRWPANHFITLMRDLYSKYNAQFLLFWSPGDEHNPHHPGDDRKAAEIMEAVKDLPVLAYPTEKLEELIGAISVCDAMICSDGGAMHVGAGLGKPIVCFFGNSDAAVWHPWGVPYELLQKESRNVADISAEEALQAFERLLPFIKMERPSIENMN
ncbi:glycosyltransferase family 9 protein [Leeia oryzae]|uniref:glycosyltransferase family 9 protein n=1 Tax=Leeia oryzae TaxID=356662 RepID=UPI000372D540|nr:glycosyltransferase family 9 protein [Leeia oryzae]